MRKNISLILGGIAGFLLVGLLAFGFWYLALSHRQLPEDVFLMSLRKMASVNTYSVSGEITLIMQGSLSSLFSTPQSESPKSQIKNDAQTPLSQESTLRMSGNGASNRKNSFHPKGFFTLQVKVDNPGDKINAKADIDARIDGETIYFKFTDAHLGNTPFAALSGFEGRWIQGNIPALTKQYIGDSVAKRVGEARAKQLFSAQEFSQFISIDAQTKPFLVSALPDAAKGSMPVYHLSITPQSEGTRKFLLSLLDFLRQRGLQEKDALAMSKMFLYPSFTQALDQFTKQSKFELWIDKTTLLLRKVLFKFNFGDRNLAEITLALGNYDQDIPVTFPSNSTPIEQIIQEFLSSLVPSDQTVKS